MVHQTFHDFIPTDAIFGDGVESMLETLERNGWYPHGLMGSGGIRYWPDFARSKQITVPYKGDVAEQQLEFFAKHTGIEELLKVRERE